MENQNIATQENMQISIIERLDSASRVINQVYAWSARVEELQKLAKKEEEATAKAKNKRMIIRIFSPFISFCIAKIVLAFYSPFGLDSESILAFTVGILVWIASIVFFWCLPFGVKQHKRQAEEYALRAKEGSDSVRALINKHSNVIAVVPEKYRYPMATNYLIELFQLGRATTLPMAYDKLEEQIHRWKMESAMQKALAYQMQQAQILKNVQKSSAVSAAANTVSAVASVANLLSN